MRKHITGLAVVFLFVSGLAYAQDTKYAPKGQQIPGPECLTMKGAWEGGSLPCTANEHEKWLAPNSHRLRRISLRETGIQVDAIQLHAATNDGGGPVLL